MENYIKDRFEELKADGIICTKKEKYYLKTLEQKQNNFNKLNGNEIDPTITELIKNFNSALTRGLKDRYWEEIHMKALRFRIY